MSFQGTLSYPDYLKTKRNRGDVPYTYSNTFELWFTAPMGSRKSIHCYPRMNTKGDFKESKRIRLEERWGKIHKRLYESKKLVTVDGKLSITFSEYGEYISFDLRDVIIRHEMGGMYAPILSEGDMVKDVLAIFVLMALNGLGFYVIYQLQALAVSAWQFGLFTLIEAAVLALISCLIRKTREYTANQKTYETLKGLQCLLFFMKVVLYIYLAFKMTESPEYPPLEFIRCALIIGLCNLFPAAGYIT